MPRAMPNRLYKQLNNNFSTVNWNFQSGRNFSFNLELFAIYFALTATFAIFREYERNCQKLWIINALSSYWQCIVCGFENTIMLKIRPKHHACLEFVIRRDIAIINLIWIYFFEKLIDHLMAGMEDIVGKTGNYNVRDKFKRFDNKFIRPLILKHIQVSCISHYFKRCIQKKEWELKTIH